MKTLASRRLCGLCSDELNDPFSQRPQRLPRTRRQSLSLIHPSPCPTIGEHLKVTELKFTSVSLEKSLQKAIEQNLTELLGMTFLATEHSTGQKHGGRIDTLAIDENRCPVIVEYKRAMNENVINQGLYYLDWLMDHKAEFQLLVMSKLEKVTADSIEWSSPRLLCIAGEFTKYDEYAVQQINRNVELVRYRRYGDEFLLFELVNATVANHAVEVVSASRGTSKTFSEFLAAAKPDLHDRFQALRDFSLALGDDVQEKTLKFYAAFKRLRNFCCVEVHTRTNNMIVYLNINPTSITLEKGYSRDVSKIGHFGTGNLELTIRNLDDLEKAKPLIAKSYESS